MDGNKKDFLESHFFSVIWLSKGTKKNSLVLLISPRKKIAREFAPYFFARINFLRLFLLKKNEKKLFKKTSWVAEEEKKKTTLDREKRKFMQPFSFSFSHPLFSWQYNLSFS